LVLPCGGRGSQRPCPASSCCMVVIDIAAAHATGASGRAAAAMAGEGGGLLTSRSATLPWAGGEASPSQSRTAAAGPGQGRAGRDSKFGKPSKSCCSSGGARGGGGGGGRMAAPSHCVHWMQPPPCLTTTPHTTATRRASPSCSMGQGHGQPPVAANVARRAGKEGGGSLPAPHPPAGICSGAARPTAAECRMQ
jgi:hypothetical protein